MQRIRRVVVAGGSGNLGPGVVKGLLDADFRVTVLTRGPDRDIDSRAKVKQVNYGNLAQLVEVLRGHDAVVSCLAVGVIRRETHVYLVEAARRAGIKRFIPSEFGCDTTSPAVSQLTVFQDKRWMVSVLHKFAQSDPNFSWTALVTGPFLDWGLCNRFILNLRGPWTTIYDGGDVRFSVTTTEGVGKAVAGILSHPEETKNRYCQISEADVTQNQLLKLAGKEDKIKLVPVKTEELEVRGRAALASNPPNLPLFASCMARRAFFAEGFGGLFRHSQNILLGVPRLSESELKDILMQYC